MEMSSIKLLNLWLLIKIENIKYKNSFSSNIQQCFGNDSSECFESFHMAKIDIFKWIEDEYQSIFKGKSPILTLQDRIKRESLDGETDYIMFLQNERRSDKSYQNKENSHVEVPKLPLKNVAEIPSNTEKEKIQSKAEKLYSNNNSGKYSENNVKTMNAGTEWQVQLLQDMSNHFESHHTKTDSNYDASIEGRLNTKLSLASEQNAIHEIGLNYQHLRNDDEFTTEKVHAEKLLNENQLSHQIESSLNNNFHQIWSPYNSPTDSPSPPQLLTGKRSTGQMQKQLKNRHNHYQRDDQMSNKKNDLWDEIEEKLSKTEQQGLHQSFVPLHRVKRRDVINQMNEKNVNIIEMNEIGNNQFISDDVNLADEFDGDVYEDNIRNNDKCKFSVFSIDISIIFL